MTPNELSEHRGYLADEQRIAAFRAALAEVVGPEDVVLDLGAGTGILGYLACEAGAKSVIAVDRGAILETARRIASDNGFADRITHIKAMSTELALDTPVDVLVCDQIGGLVHDAGILSSFADARKRLAAPNARLVPASFVISAAPVEYGEAREEIEFWSSKPASIDVSAVRPFAANAEWMMNLDVEDVVALAPGQEFASFASDHDDPITGTAEFLVDQHGRLDGFIGWFEATLSPSITLTNNPWSPDRFKRWSNFYPIDKAIEVQKGDLVKVRLHVRPQGGIVSWHTVIKTRDGEREFRQSTFLSKPKSDLFTRASEVKITDKTRMARAVLDLVDGSRTAEDIVDILADEVGKAFVSRVHLENFVRKVTAVID